MTKVRKVVLVAVALALPASAVAQALGPAGRPFENERRIGVSLSIPLGGPTAARNKPQLELRSSGVGDPNERFLSARGEPALRLFPARNREARIGFTLEAHPRLTIAGREMPMRDNRLGISTIGWVAIGVAAAAVVGGLVFVDAVNDASE